MRIDQLQQEFELECRYHPFPLHPETPPEGVSLEQLFGGRLDIPAALAQLAQVADSLGLPFGSRSHTYNSRNAQELGLWAAQQGRFKPYLDAVYHAYFVEGLNIAREEELLRISAAAGLDAIAARPILQQRSYAAALDHAWQQARAAGIGAVPTLRCGGRELVGFQTLEACRQLVTG